MTKEEIIQMLKDNPIKEINLGGKNLLEGTYFDGNGIPKMIGITKAEYLEYKKSKDNWDKLREYIRETKLKEFEKSYGKRFGKTFTQAEVIVCNMILDKMQKLEQGSDSND